MRIKLQYLVCTFALFFSTNYMHVIQIGFYCVVFAINRDKPYSAHKDG